VGLLGDDRAVAPQPRPDLVGLVLAKRVELDEPRVELDLVAVGGPAAETLAAAAVDAGMASDRVRHYGSSDEAADAVAALIEPGDVVLVKGSRGVRTERVVERLKAERG
jgi:UDP-N-acetylmuramyl pentapeptide synthase